MSYESKFFVVEKSTMPDYENENYVYGQVVTGFNAGCIPCIDEIKKYPLTNAYIYYNDEKVYEDKYGDKLIEIPIPDLIKIIRKASKNDNYRRYSPLLGLLKGFNLEQWNDIVVLHYGY